MRIYAALSAVVVAAFAATSTGRALGAAPLPCLTWPPNPPGSQPCAPPPPPASQADINARCATWYDLGLTALACSQADLEIAVAHNTFKGPGSFSLLVDGHHTGTAPGLAQVIGGPARVPLRVRFSGKPAIDEIVVVNVFRGHELYKVGLSNISARTHAQFLIQSDRRGGVRVRLTNLTARTRIVRAN